MLDEIQMQRRKLANLLDEMEVSADPEVRALHRLWVRYRSTCGVMREHLYRMENQMREAFVAGSRAGENAFDAITDAEAIVRAVQRIEAR